MNLRKYHTIIIVSLLLSIASMVAASIRAQNRGYRNAMGEYEVDICRESRYGALSQTGQIIWTVEKWQTCAKDIRRISQNYVAHGSLVYWMTSVSYKERPCISGTGDGAAIFHNLSIECLTSRNDQLNLHEDRRLILTTRFSPAFHRINDNGLTYREEWQRNQFENFAADSFSVYFENKTIDGADPTDFSVIFPFTDEKWRNFHFSSSRGNMFVNGVSIPEINISRFELLEFVHRPKRGVRYRFDATLTMESNPDTFGYKGLLGRIGNDLIYLRRDGATVFKNMATKDAFVFIDPQHMYLLSAGQFYDVAWNSDKQVASLAVVDADTINRRFEAQLGAGRAGS